MDKFEPIRVLGEGSFGKVYLMRDKIQRKFVCVKVIKIKNIPKKERDATKMEVDLLRRLHHPNIVRYIDSFLSKNNESLCIAMEYCDGGDLAAQIKAARKNMFSENKILNWFVQIALGVHHMHSNQVLHRDLKTQNIFLTGNGRLVLGDLGISKVLEGTMDFAKTCIGTPYYMSPEIFKNKPYSYKSDVWALGCVLYEMTTLNHAFDSNSINGLAQKIIKGRYPPIHSKYSKYLKDLITEMLMLEPRQRPDLDQILRKPFIKKHIINFFSDIASRPTSSIGEGTMIVRTAAGGGTFLGPENDANVIAFRKQLNSLDMSEEVQRALGPKAAPSNPVEAKKVVKEQAGALAREQDHKKMVEIALEKLRQERELRIKDRNSMAANARARGVPAAAPAPAAVQPGKQISQVPSDSASERQKREEMLKPAALRQPVKPPLAAPVRSGLNSNMPAVGAAREADARPKLIVGGRERERESEYRRRSFGEDRDRIHERERQMAEARRLLLEQEEKQRADDRKKEDLRLMAERAEAKRIQIEGKKRLEEEKMREAKDEIYKQRIESQAEAVSRREIQRERERERQRDEIEQLKKDKLELDRRTNEREKMRENRRVEERKKLEEALKERDIISQYERRQLDALEEKLSEPTDYSAQERVLKRKQEKLAKEESDRFEQLRMAEQENRRIRALANVEGRANYQGSNLRGKSDAMDVDELSSALKDASVGPPRYDSVTGISKVTESKKTLNSDTDSDDEELSPNKLWERDSGFDNSDVEEDLRKREEELREELKIATMRCTQLKATLKETKSFFSVPTNAQAGIGIPIIRPKENSAGGEDDSDYQEDDIVDDDIGSDLEESWTEQSTNIRDGQGKSSSLESKDSLDNTALLNQIKPPVAVKVTPYYNLQDCPSPSGRLSDRIERLRQRCKEALGKAAFEDAYLYLKQQENDDRGFYEEEAENEKQKRVRAILGEGKAHFMPLIEQLIFMEETHSS